MDPCRRAQWLSDLVRCLPELLRLACVAPAGELSDVLGDPAGRGVGSSQEQKRRQADKDQAASDNEKIEHLGADVETEGYSHHEGAQESESQADHPRYVSPTDPFHRRTFP